MTKSDIGQLRLPKIQTCMAVRINVVDCRSLYFSGHSVLAKWHNAMSGMTPEMKDRFAAY